MAAPPLSPFSSRPRGWTRLPSTCVENVWTIMMGARRVRQFRVSAAGGQDPSGLGVRVRHDRRSRAAERRPARCSGTCSSNLKGRLHLSRCRLYLAMLCSRLLIHGLLVYWRVHTSRPCSSCHQPDLRSHSPEMRATGCQWGAATTLIVLLPNG